MYHRQLGPVYPITAEPVSCGRSLEEQARLFLQAGIRFFQVRAKLLPVPVLLAELERILALAERHKAAVVVNDRVDLALAVQAAGVHLGQEDLPVEAARRLLGPGRIIGLSTHSASEFLAAQDSPADYVALGPIFPTATKADAARPLGVRLIKEVVPHKKKPLVAVGGITLERAAAVWQAGADSVAVISDVAQAADPADRLQAYLERWRSVEIE